jgi:alkanesulfonate monooxygenase
VQWSSEVQIYATCPQSSDVAREAHTQRVINVARWSEDAGCHGMPVYTGNGIADPWLVSQLVIQHTTTLIPLVAVQPAYLTPLSAAKMVASLGWMHGRAVAFNMVADGAPVTHKGKHYRVRNLRMAPRLPLELMPDILASGSSAAGGGAAFGSGSSRARPLTKRGRSRRSVFLTRAPAASRMGWR